ncbi:MAG: hypothetical protein MHPSP_002325, partial [Paramarteilia canceri]
KTQFKNQQKYHGFDYDIHLTIQEIFLQNKPNTIKKIRKKSDKHSSGSSPIGNPCSTACLRLLSRKKSHHCGALKLVIPSSKCASSPPGCILCCWTN